METIHPGVILSGGRSARMGCAKAMLAFGKTTLLDHVAARLSRQAAPVFLNANDPDIILAGVERFADRFPAFPGPLAGIHAALAHVSEAGLPGVTHVAILQVDSPFFPADLVVRLAEALQSPDDASLAQSDGRLHPVVGLWPLSALPSLDAWLRNPPTLKVRAFLDTLPTRQVPFAAIETPLGPVDPFFNINTPDDLAHARTLLPCLNEESPRP